MKIVCQPTDCEHCKYNDCIGTIRKKPGRKPLPEEERKRRKRERHKMYYQTHKEQFHEYYIQHYAKKNS